MHKNATKCNETLSKWCKNKHGASKIMDTLETYQHTNNISGAIIRSVMKLASITFRSLVLSPTGSIYLGFTTEERLAVVLIIPSLGVPNWSVIYISIPHHQASFLAPLPGRKKISARGVSHAQSFTFFLFCFTLFLLASFYQKYKKKLVSFIDAFTCLLLALLE
jgi:hypothetical protein